MPGSAVTVKPLCCVEVQKYVPSQPAMTVSSALVLAAVWPEAYLYVEACNYKTPVSSNGRSDRYQAASC